MTLPRHARAPAARLYIDRGAAFVTGELDLAVDQVGTTGQRSPRVIAHIIPMGYSPVKRRHFPVATRAP